MIAVSSWLLVLVAAAPADIQVSETSRGYRYETQHAVIEFGPGSMLGEDRLEFASMAEDGITNIARLLQMEPETTLLFRVSDRAPISRAVGARILLPYRRVATRSAPYLHETVHALLSKDGEQPPMWLSEGFASYLESYVAEHIAGYDAGVFSEDGNVRIDAEASDHLRSTYGRDALNAIGTRRVPLGIHQDRDRVARPFYVLSQSFVKFLVEHVGLDEVVRMHQEGGAQVGGRAISAWKREWEQTLRLPPSE